MGFWRKKEDGFDWQEYVRTTILLRRQDRRNKIEEMRAAALDSVKEGGRKSVDAAAAGLGAVGEKVAPAIRSGRAAAAERLRSAAAGTASLLRRAAGLVAAGVAGLLAGLGRMMPQGGRPRLAVEPLGRAFDHYRLRPVLVLAGGTAALVAAVRWARFGADTDAVLAAAVAAVAGLVLLLGRDTDEGADRAASPGAAVHAWLEGIGERAVLVPGLDRLDHVPAALTLIAVVAASGLLVWNLSGATTPGSAPAPASVARSAAPSSPSVVEGKAIALAGDRLRVGGRVIRLEGIEAPDADQDCAQSDGKSWHCGATARAALDRLVRSRVVACTISAGATDGAEPGTCTIAGADIAADLVRQGHVFAEAGLFASYAGEEHSARSSKAGVWTTGSAERPAEWRQRRWEEARKEAPNGCPIKARIRSGSRTYMLPWSPDYDRAKVRESRGDRWFCSEEEAKTAGWIYADRL